MERAEKECVSATAIAQWQRTLNMAEQICVNIQVDQLDAIKINYNNEIEKCQNDAKYWKNSYLWLQKKNIEKQNGEKQ